MKKLLLLVILSPVLSLAQISAKEVLAKTVTYHDPNNEWPILKATFVFKETRPDGPDKTATITLNNKQSFMKINRNDEDVYGIVGNIPTIVKGNESNERALMLRNYYLYLWGLPMKLNDEGTPIDKEVKEELVAGVECYVLRVPYEKDTWYFSIDKETGRMVQYKFYQDEVAGKGELIKLEDEIQVGSIKIPQKRSWYTLPEMKYLGTDILVKGGVTSDF